MSEASLQSSSHSKAGPPPIDEHGRKVQAMFGAIAPGYDRANRVMSLGTDIRWRRKAVRKLVPTDGRTNAMLDLCAGTMDSTLEIHRHYPEARLVAGDFSAGMLEAGKKRLVGSAKEKITPIPMDAHQLPLADQEFDSIFCAFGVRNLSNLKQACAEKHRVLRPGGRLVVLDFFRPTNLYTKAFHAVYNHTVLPAVGWACTGNLDAYLYLPRSIGNFLSAPAYKELLENSGFSDVSIKALSGGIASLITATRQGELPA